MPVVLLQLVGDEMLVRSGAVGLPTLKHQPGGDAHVFCKKKKKKMQTNKISTSAEQTLAPIIVIENWFGSALWCF